MLEANKPGVLETVSIKDHTKCKRFEFDLNKFPNLQVLVGKNIGDKFKKSDISKSCVEENEDEEYEITNFKPYRIEEKTQEKEHGIIKFNTSWVKDEAPKSEDTVQQLINHLKTFGFEGFVHTTEFSNFKSIVKKGQLIPRSNLESKYIKFTDRANSSVIHKTNDYVKCCCRFYYAYDTPTNYTANYQQPVSMIFDESLAYEPKAQFAPMNACYGKYSNNISEVLNYDWEGIFERGYYSLSKYSNSYGPEMNEETKHKINAVRNAEFLLCGEVSISFIKKIVVYDEEVFKEVRAICDDELFKKVILRKVGF